MSIKSIQPVELVTPGPVQKIAWRKWFEEYGFTELLLPQNPVGFPSRCRLFGHAEELFREVRHGDERLQFRGDLLGNILSFSEGVAESVDIDFGENFFE